jgi:hypothetical protein
VRALLPPVTLLLVTWESYMIPSWPEYTETPPKTGGSSYFLIEKSPKTAFYHFINTVKTFNKISF